MIEKKTVIIHSGGMDSSLCLAQAIYEFGRENVLSLSFSYHQRHSEELKRAKIICDTWGVDHVLLDINCLSQITENSLTRHSLPVLSRKKGASPNSLVVGRNGLMARIGAIQANSLKAHSIYMGILQAETAHSGYRDCSRAYMDKMEEILKMDLDDPLFEIRTPLVDMSKAQTMELGYQLGVLDFLLETTITCYEGMDKIGCRICPSCILRNQGIVEFLNRNPEISLRNSCYLEILH